MQLEQLEQMQALAQQAANLAQQIADLAGLQRQDADSLRNALSAQGVHLQQQIQQLIEQLVQASHHTKEIEQGLLDFQEQLATQIATQTEAVRIIALDAQKRVDEQSKAIAHLQENLKLEQLTREQHAETFEKALQRERQEREALASLVERLTKQPPQEKRK